MIDPRAASPLPATPALAGTPSHLCLVVPDRERAITELTPVYGEFVRLPPREGGTHISTVTLAPTSFGTCPKQTRR